MTYLCVEIILCMHPANKKPCNIVTLSFTDWVHTQNDPCMWSQVSVNYVITGSDTHDNGLLSSRQNW